MLCRTSATGEPVAVDLSVDHRPSRPDEVARVAAAGGFIVNNRVAGMLAVSRALGDVEMKVGGRCVVSPEPELHKVSLRPGDAFVIVACDGLWDVMSGQEAVDFVHKKLAESPSCHRVSEPGAACDTGPFLDAVARSLANHAIDVRGSTDNVSVIIVCIRYSSRPSSHHKNAPGHSQAPHRLARRHSSLTMLAAARSAARRRRSSCTASPLPPTARSAWGAEFTGVTTTGTEPQQPAKQSRSPGRPLSRSWLRVRHCDNGAGKSDESQWYYIANDGSGMELGPFGLKTMRAWWANGQLPHDLLVRLATATGHCKLGSCPDIVG